MQKIVHFVLSLIFICLSSRLAAQCTASVTSASGSTACGSAVLTANTGSGYQWSNASAPITSATSQTYTATATGNYTVTVYNGSCNAVSTAYNLTINPLPVIVFNYATPCINSGTVCVNGEAFRAYQWQYSGANIAGATSNCITPINTGTYVVNVTNTTTGCTKSSPIVISAPPSTPVATSNSPVVTGSSILLSGNSGVAGVAYSWSGPNGFTSNQQNPVLTAATAAMAGKYYLYSTLNGCSSPTDSVMVVVTGYAAGIANAHTSYQVAVVPNPSADAAMLNINTAKNETALVRIVTVTGAVVASYTLAIEAGQHSYPLQCAGLPTGMYQVKLNFASGASIAFKWVKKG